MRRKVKISDVAKQSGVSVSPASLALSNKPGVSEETRFKVYQIDVELDYPVKHILGSSKTSRRNEINLLFANLPVDKNNHPLETPLLLNLDIVRW
jgi:DNA-binding LacI/PurR family transcriptional regulator